MGFPVNGSTEVGWLGVILKPTYPRLQPKTWNVEPATAPLFAPKAGVEGSAVQWMLFQVPEGACGTLGSGSTTAVDVAVGVILGVVVGVADADTEAVSDGLAAGKTEAEPLEVTPTQPAATRAASTKAAPLRHLRLLRNSDFTDCPLRKIIDAGTHL
jgi:hypothetical protein